MTGIVLKVVFWSCIGLLAYVYRGYEWLLRLASAGMGPGDAPSPAAGDSVPPKVTVLITVHNEAERIEKRIANVLASDYPSDRLEVLIASDGSQDGTDGLVESLGTTHPVRLFASGGRLGKTETQNRALSAATGEIVVFSDAETLFASNFLSEIVRPFREASVGMTTGMLRLVDSGGVAAPSQGAYWAYELRLRRLESKLGILAVASGQAMAVRRKLLRRMDPTIGEDCIVPLDVVLQGCRVVHCDAAEATDTFESEPAKELRTRIRMTLRNWLGTWSRPQLLNPLKHPGYALALWSHKLMRWLGPFIALAATLSLFGLLGQPLYAVLAGLTLLGYVGAGIGWAAGRRNLRVPVAGQLYSFCLANAGFAIGVCKALMGHRVVTYRSGVLERQAAPDDRGER